MLIDWNSTAGVVSRVAQMDRLRVEAGNDELEQFFMQPIPEKLWHYTSIEGLEGILRTGRVWATEVHSTNDSTEFTYARDVATTYLKRQSGDTPEQEHLRKACIDIITGEFGAGSLSEDKSEVFIASFSATADLKGQWNDYAKQGEGVSIAFDLRAIRPPRELGLAVTLSPCVYETQEQEQLLAAAFRHFVQTTNLQYEQSVSMAWMAQRLHDWQQVDRAYGTRFSRTAFDAALHTEFSEALRSGIALSKFDLLRVASNCKHSYFAEEREWRLALPHMKNTPLAYNQIEYRGSDNRIPYVAHNLFHRDTLPIVEVMTGPFCVHGERVRNLLDECGYSAPVVLSRSPIRKPG